MCKANRDIIGLDNRSNGRSVHLWNHFENEIEKSSQKCSVSSQIAWTEWQWRYGEVTEQEPHQSLE